MSQPPTTAPPLAAEPAAGRRLLTAADLEVLPTELPSGPVRYELHDGRLFIMTPPGDIHGAVETKIIAALYLQGEQVGHGKARCGDVGIVIRRNPDTVVGADAVFITNASLPIKRSPEGYLETIPELVVEVRSKNDSIPETQRWAQDYLDAGVRLVWIVDPFAGNVVAYRKNQPPQTLGADDVLTAEDLIPGFRLPVAEALRE